MMGTTEFCENIWDLLEKANPVFVEELRTDMRRFMHEEFEENFSPEVLLEFVRLVREYDVWEDEHVPCMSIPDPKTGRSLEIYDDDVDTYTKTDGLNIMVHKPKA